MPSPRGGAPGFVRVQDERTLWIPDSPGNNRLDTLHCAKAFMRSNLWSDQARVARSCYPSIAEVIRDQIGAAGPVETREQMLARYQADL